MKIPETAGPALAEDKLLCKGQGVGGRLGRAAEPPELKVGGWCG